MKITELIAQLDFVREQYGDLDCAVYAESGLQRVKPARVYVQQDFDFGAPGAFVAQQKNVIAFSAASDPKFGVQGVGPLAYSVSNAGQAQGALMAEWAYNKKGWKKAYVRLAPGHDINFVGTE